MSKSPDAYDWRTFSWRFRVRTYELDINHHVNNAVMANYLQETATRASSDAGYAYDWYFEQGKVWVIRNLKIRYYAPAFYGDELQATTWVGAFKRIRSYRDYVVRKIGADGSEGELVAKARAEWIYLNMETHRPERIPPEMLEAFGPIPGEVQPLELGIKDAQTPAAPHTYHSERRAAHYELDPAAIVNNGVYVRWAEAATFDAMASAGWPDARLRENNMALVQIAHDMTYLQSVRDGDPITIESRVSALSETRLGWHHAFTHADTGDVLARNDSVMALTRLDGTPCRVPQEIAAALVAGPA